MQPFTYEQFRRLLAYISTVIDFHGYHAIEVPEANKPLVEWFYNHIGVDLFSVRFFLCYLFSPSDAVSPYSWGVARGSWHGPVLGQQHLVFSRPRMR